MVQPTIFHHFPPFFRCFSPTVSQLAYDGTAFYLERNPRSSETIGVDKWWLNGDFDGEMGIWWCMFVDVYSRMYYLFIYLHKHDTMIFWFMMCLKFDPIIDILTNKMMTYTIDSSLTIFQSNLGGSCASGCRYIHHGSDRFFFGETLIKELWV